MNEEIDRRKSARDKKLYEKKNPAKDNCFISPHLELTYLRCLCDSLNIEHFYERYVQRLQKSSLSLFIVVHSITIVSHIVLILITQKETAFSTPDFYAYFIGLVVVVMCQIILFKKNSKKQYKILSYILSYLTIVVIMISDFIVTFYHIYETPRIRPAYSSHCIFAIYIFLPVTANFHAILMGLSTTASYAIIYGTITFRTDKDKVLKIISELVFLLTLNIVGMFYRLMKEIIIRKICIDRREFVEESFEVKYYQQTEREFIMRILPKHVYDELKPQIQKVIMKIQEYDPINLQSDSKMAVTISRWNGSAFDKTHVKPHSNVSIIFADIVKYTELTTKVNVAELVQILHELFVKFDEAANECNVLRIKFLGDCYYGVSGIPEYDEHHAKNCVDLGLRMVEIIKLMRKRRRGLNIDMRIGVHSGDVSAGVIGACKWQYDIWSKDVDIANRLESTGISGKVHVSKQTLDQLYGEYLYYKGPNSARDDSFLKANSINESFIIHRPIYDLSTQEGSVEHVISNAENHSNTSDRAGFRVSQVANRQNFIKNTLDKFNEIHEQTEMEMQTEVERMPIGRLQFEKWLNWTEDTEDVESRRVTDLDLDHHVSKNISPIILYFRNDPKLELMYFKEPNYIFKYSVSMALILLIAVLIIEGLNTPRFWLFWLVAIWSIIVCTITVIIAWFHKLIIEEDELERENQSKLSKFLLLLNKMSHQLAESLGIRITIYIILVISVLSSSLIYWADFNPDFILDSTTNLPRVLTAVWTTIHCMLLTICLCFIFLKIHFLFKLTLAIAIAFFYAWISFDTKFEYFNNANTINIKLKPQIAQLFTILKTTVFLHLIDRQREYITRVDFNWKQQLINKQKISKLTHQSNSVLLENILPAHVVNIFMNQSPLSSGFYYEDHDKVAVMFAKIIHTNKFDDPNGSLTVLNCLIRDFDQILLSQQSTAKIEKIKVAGWTYMAACGLNFVTVPDHSDTDPSANSVYVMTNFALNLMRETKHCETDMISAQLQIGIAYGDVMAGVIGASKPLFDIWGHTVNMASRMESHGQIGCIHVTENAAEALQNFDIACESQGLKKIKGVKNNIRTYHVVFDDNFNIVSTESTNL